MVLCKAKTILASRICLHDYKIKNDRSEPLNLIFILETSLRPNFMFFRIFLLFFWRGKNELSYGASRSTKAAVLPPRMTN